MYRLILDIPNSNGSWAISNNPGDLIRYAIFFNPDCKDAKDPGNGSCGDGRFIVSGEQKSYVHNLVLIPKGEVFITKEHTKYVIQKDTMDTFFDCVLSKSNQIGICATRIQHVYYKWKCTGYRKQK